MRLARVLGGVGRVLITAGVLILLFVAYQLWGTNIREAQAQRDLESSFEDLLDEAPEPPSEAERADPETVPPIDPVPQGEATARIRIPEIGVDKIVVEGVSVPDLKKGPGHYPGTPLPGQEGNAAVAGHRTTYGAPFNRIDELEPGDEIVVETVQGEFTYLVMPQPDPDGGPDRGHHIISPTQVEVLDDVGDDRLTLTACHPKYSAAQRIVVVGELVGPALPSTAAEATIVDDVDGEDASIVPTILLGAVAALVWLLAWLLSRVWRKWPAYALGLPFFLVALFFFFEEFSRLLPANF